MSNPYVSPIFSSNSSGKLPPILFQFGESELLRDEAISFYSKVMPDAQIVLEMYSNQVHVFQYIFQLTGCTQVKVANSRILDFIKSVKQGKEISRRSVIIDEEGAESEFDNPFKMVEDGVTYLKYLRVYEEGALKWWDSVAEMHGIDRGPKYLEI